MKTLLFHLNPSYYGCIDEHRPNCSNIFYDHIKLKLRSRQWFWELLSFYMFVTKKRLIYHNLFIFLFCRKSKGCTFLLFSSTFLSIGPFWFYLELLKANSWGSNCHSNQRCVIYFDTSFQSFDQEAAQTHYPHILEHALEVLAVHKSSESISILHWSTPWGSLS